MSGARFAGRVAVVTGASRGIGLGIAERLGREGARVVLNARHAEELDAAVARLVAAGVEAVGVAGSASSDGAAARIVAAAVEQWGRIDHVINNIGINPHYGSLRTITRDAFEKTMVTNTWTTVALVQEALGRGLADGGGSVLAVTTSGTRNASTVTPAYVASKAALDSVVRSLARDLGPIGVRVNAIGPGLVRTHLARALWEGGRGDVHESLVPMRRIGEPSDIGAAAAFLLSDDAAWVTGSVLPVDGGFLLIGGDPEVIDELTLDEHGRVRADHMTRDQDSLTE